jgi:hypothetical protein
MIGTDSEAYLILFDAAQLYPVVCVLFHSNETIQYICLSCFKHRLPYRGYDPLIVSVLYL